MQTSRHLARSGAVVGGDSVWHRRGSAGLAAQVATVHDRPGPSSRIGLLPHKSGSAAEGRSVPPRRHAPHRGGTLPSVAQCGSPHQHQRGSVPRARARECRARMQRWRVRTDRARVLPAPQRSGLLRRGARAELRAPPRARGSSTPRTVAAAPRTGSRNDSHARRRHVQLGAQPRRHRCVAANARRGRRRWWWWLGNPSALRACARARV